MSIYVTSEETHDSIDFFCMYLKPDWGVKKDTLNPYLSLWFFPSYVHQSDTAKYCVTINTNFEMDLHSIYNDNISDSICNDKEWTYNLYFDKEEMLPQFQLISESSILNDPETPYVNLYVEINKYSRDVFMPWLTEYQMGDSTYIDKWKDYNGGFSFGFYIKLGQSFENEEMEKMEGGEKEKADVLPYDLVTAKPEPLSYSPFQLEYNTPEKYMEIMDKGLFISVVNRDLEIQQEREAILHSVIIGALISILFTLVLKLLERWKDLNKKEGKEDLYDEL